MNEKYSGGSVSSHSLGSVIYYLNKGGEKDALRIAASKISGSGQKMNDRGLVKNLNETPVSRQALTRFHSNSVFDTLDGLQQSMVNRIDAAVERGSVEVEMLDFSPAGLDDHPAFLLEIAPDFDNPADVKYEIFIDEERKEVTVRNHVALNDSTPYLIPMVNGKPDEQRAAINRDMVATTIIPLEAFHSDTQEFFVESASSIHAERISESLPMIPEAGVSVDDRDFADRFSRTLKGVLEGSGLQITRTAQLPARLTRKPESNYSVA